MGKDKDYITVEITIEGAVKAIVKSFGETQDDVVIAMANHMLVTGFDMPYEEYEVTIPDQEPVHVECRMPCDAVIRHLHEVYENGWEGVNIDSKYCKLITKTKDGEMVIYPGTKYEKKIAKTKKDRKKYTGEPIPFREFKAKIARFEELRKQNDMPIPEYWISEGGERAGKDNNIDTGSKRKNKYSPRGALGRLMLDLAEAFAKNRNGALIGSAEMLALLNKGGATVKSSDEEYVKFTDTITRKIITVSKDAFGGRLGRIRKHIKEIYPT